MLIQQHSGLQDSAVTTAMLAQSSWEDAELRLDLPAAWAVGLRWAILRCCEAPTSLSMMRGGSGFGGG